MRTAVYIRVSTEEQAREGFSIAAQREKLLAYVHSQDWKLASLYVDEGASAKDTNRPQLARLLSDIKYGGIDVVLSIAWTASRVLYSTCISCCRYSNAMAYASRAAQRYTTRRRPWDASLLLW